MAWPYPYTLATATLSPELIITLSRHKVDLQLLPQVEKGIHGWRDSFAIEGLFLEEKIGEALDQALAVNPDLLADYTCVYLVVLDQPNMWMPSYLAREGRMAEVAARHLRSRTGDALLVNELSSRDLICYSLPRPAIELIREYYSQMSSVHLASIMWKEIVKRDLHQAAARRSTFFALVEDVLLVMATEAGKLIFTKQFIIRDAGDLQYYTLACSRLLKSTVHHLLEVEGHRSSFSFTASPHLAVDQVIRLESLAALLNDHFPCVS